MRQVVAAVILILTLTGALASGLRADGPCPMLAKGSMARMTHQIAAASDAHAHHGSTHRQSGPAGDFCKFACLATILPTVAAATPLALRIVSVADPAEQSLPGSRHPARTDRPPKDLA